MGSDTLCYIEMFGWLRVRTGDQVIARFATQQTGALLAQLAYTLDRAHPRDELIECLWPEVGPESGRNRLRVTLSSLKSQLQSAGGLAPSLLIADRHTVRLDADLVQTDVQTFLDALRDTERSDTNAERARHLTTAVETYTGDLLTGYHHQWIVKERERLSALCVDALCRLADLCESAGDYERATSFARRALGADPYREDACRVMMRGLTAQGQRAAALLQYRGFRQRLRQSLGAAPSEKTRAVLAWIRQSPEAPSLASPLAVSAAALPESSQAPTNRPPPGPVTVSDTQLPDTPPSAVGSASPYTPEAQNGSALRYTSASPNGSAPPLATNLPPRIARFFGRDAEMALLHTLLMPSENRLINLIGLGGVGKTRLAIEAAHAARERFHNEVYFVALGDCLDPERIAIAALDALGLPSSPVTEPERQLIEALNRRLCLLVLDNFEHLAEGGDQVLERILARLPWMSLLVTSRSQLHVVGEQVVPVHPLSVPSSSGSVESLMASPSVQLFIDRVQAVRPDFHATPRTVGTIAAICERLEGIPLAIQLLAAWAHILSPAQMLERLDARFDLLVSRRHQVGGRHSSLRATLDWSYDLLRPELQSVFARLSVFRGGWMLSDAEAVCGSDGILDELASLQERSLIYVEDTDEEMTFRMLESVREYAREFLSEHERARLSRHHAAHFKGVAVSATDALGSPWEMEALRSLERRLENVRCALAWTLEHEPEWALEMVAALSPFWETRGHVTEGRHYMEEALARTASGEPGIRSRALAGAGRLCLLQGDFAAACEYLDESLAIAIGRDDGPAVALALLHRGLVASYQGQVEAAERMLSESLLRHMEMGDRRGAAVALLNYGIIPLAHRDYRAARLRWEEALQLARSVGDEGNTALILHYLGDLYACQEDYETAQRYFDECYDTASRMNLKVTRLFSGWGKGVVACGQGDPARCRPALMEALSGALEMGNKWALALVLEEFAHLSVVEARYQRAAHLLGAANTLREEMGAPLPAPCERRYESYRRQLTEAMGQEDYTASWSEGACWSWEFAAAVAMEGKDGD